ncbi:heat shock cognate 70 kda protein 1 [Hordeum vulgare]|nr:heat shock cognate 70 kda protein 1 [Hordeum vulgare]
MGLWLLADGCCNGPAWVAVDLSPRSAMFLTWGWKSFMRSRGLGLVHLLHFRFDGDSTLFINFFGSAGSELVCCGESSNGSELDTSSGNNDGANSPNTKLEGDSVE